MSSKVLLVIRKELNTYFTSPLAYLLASFFLLIMGWLFFSTLMMSGEEQGVTLTASVVRPIFSNMNFLFLIIAPLVTMKSLAEERREGTLSLLLLSKLSDKEIIIGKVFGAFFVLFFMMCLTGIFPLILAFNGFSDWSIVISGYVGTFLNVLTYITIGVFVSSLTENQILSALVTFCLLILLMVLPYAQLIAPNVMVGQLISYFSMAYHFESFTRGVLKSDDVFYFLSAITFFVFLTQKSLDARKW